MVIPRSRSALSLSSTQAGRASRLDWRGYERLDVRTILEGALAELSSLLFELLDGTLVDTTALVDQVTSGGRLAGIDVADNCKQESESTPITETHDGDDTYRRR